MARNKEKKHFNEVTIFGVPVGKFLSDRSFLAKDETTQAGVRQAQEIIARKEEGLSVYFAHLGLLDIFGTAAVMEDFAEFKAVFPVAASWFYFPALRPIFQQLIQQIPHDFLPVYRKEEFGRENKVSVVDFSRKSESAMKSANRAYANKAEQALKNGEVVMLAPYGGRAPKQEHLRSGSIILLQEGKPVIFTLTKWNWRKFRYEVFFSKVYRFNKNISKEQSHEIIFGEFMRMAKLGGITKKQMMESKKPTLVSKSIWIFLSMLFAVHLLSGAIVSPKKSKPKK
jgi:hypothetical protein